MHAYQIQDAFGLENLTLTTRPPRRLGPGAVRVRLRAASLNYRDLLTVRGQYDPRQPLPLIPGSDGAGVVHEVGPGVTGLAVGDRVMPAFNPGWVSGELTRAARRESLGGPHDGTLAECVVVPAAGLVPIPGYLSFEQAACLPCAAVTAWSALVEYGGIKAGDDVLVQGTGGVSLFALQIAKAAGARVLVTSSSDEKLARARELGADATVNYRENPEWHRVAAEFTGGRGVDVVVEVGGAGTLGRSLKAVRLGGCVAVIGVLDGRAGEVDLAPVLMGRVRMQGVTVGSRATFEQMLRAFEAARIAPVIDRVYDFGEVPAAFRRMAEAAHFGKIVVRVGGGRAAA